MTTLLAFDTAGPWCAACLIAGDRVTTRVDAMARGQAESLMPMLAALLLAEKVDWKDLDLIGVGTGPGNFTGIRISVAAARGLALGLGKPAIGVTHLDAVAHGIARPVTVAVPAPRDSLYVQDFGDANGQIRILPANDPAATQAIRSSDPDTLIRQIAAVALSRNGVVTARPVPCYVRPADAAPARDKPPVVI